MKKNYETICKELELFLPSVGEKVIELRLKAESDPDFSRIKNDAESPHHRTIVTKADELSEDLIRAWIGQRFPDDTIVGEERGDTRGGTQTWIIDPIDGTRNFNNFGTMFGISVGLAKNNNPKVGVIFYPAEKIMLSACEGGGVWKNGKPLSVAKGNTHVSEALVIASNNPIHRSNPKYATTALEQDPLLAIARCQDIGWSYTFAFLDFLQGNADAILHFGATPYDIGAACAIAKELGLPISGYDGQPIDFSKDSIPVVISKNAKLHAEIIQTLNSGE